MLAKVEAFRTLNKIYIYIYIYKTSSVQTILNF